jgi:hypothetical protein
MVRATRLVILGLVAVGGCAALGGQRHDQDPAVQLHEGVAALASQEYLRARALLEPLVRERPDELVGQQAWLALVAAELDPRNPERRLWVAADLSARLLSRTPAEPWIVPLASTYYLTALELGGAEELAAQTGMPPAATAATLPVLERETVPARIGRVTAERDQARRQSDQLQQQLTARERELRDARQELERIRRTIRP